MIIVDDTDWLTVITQPDHARFAGELLSLWRTDGLPGHPRRDDLLMATREHDNGWQEADSAPWVDPGSQRPYDFVSYPSPDRLDLWSRGIFRFAESRPLVALLIAEHAETIHSPLSEEWQDFYANLESHRQLWLQQAGTDHDTVRRDYSFLGLADTLSLAVCAADARRLENLDRRDRLADGQLLLDPFPLAGTTTFQLPFRTVEKRPYKRDSEFASALARARWQKRQIKVGPVADPNT